MLCVKLTVCFISVLLVPEGLCLGDGTHHASFPGECRTQGSQHCRLVMRYGLVILRCLHRETEEERRANATRISLRNGEIWNGLAKLLIVYDACSICGHTLWGKMILNNAVLLDCNCKDNYGIRMKRLICSVWLFQRILERWVMIYSLLLLFYTVLR